MRALLMIALAGSLTGCTVGSFGLGERTAVYRVTGSGTAQVSYIDGGTQSGTQSLPFTATATAPNAPQQFFLTATSDSEVTCTLTVDGEVVARQTGRVVSCSG